MAEVSKIDTYRTGDLLQCIAGRANPLMDPKLFGVVLFRVVAVVTSVWRVVGVALVLVVVASLKL